MSLGSGAELPSEVIHFIVQALCATHYYGFRQQGTSVKAGLAACSLTCRYWAEMLQPFLFGSLTLRSSEDVKQLLDFFRSSPALADFVWDLQVRQRSHSHLWFHHVNKLLAYLGEDTYVTLTIDGSTSPPLPDTAKNLRSPAFVQLYSLPRTLPGSILQMTRITIDGVELRRKSDLVRFISRIPTLLSCGIKRVKFLQSHPIEPEVIRPRSFHWLREIEVSQCQDDSLTTQLELASSFLAGEGFPFDEEVRSQIVEALLSLCLPNSYSYVRVSIDPHSE